MKFFSPEHYGTLSDVEPFRQLEYMRHLEDMRGVLPEHVLELAEIPGTGDALVVRVDHDRKRRVLRLVLRCGPYPSGYYNLVLTYVDAELRPEDDVTLAKIARCTLNHRIFGCDLAYHELDAVEGGRIDHCLIFHSRECSPPASGWKGFSIRCRILRWRREPKRSRRLLPSQDRYPGGPPS